MAKPVCFFDLETTGTDVHKDRIVEIAIVKLIGKEEVAEFHRLVNPEIPIPKGASDIHHITDERVTDAPKLIDIVPDILAIITGSDLAGYNSNNFDIPVLVNELRRVGHTLDLTDVSFFDACTIFKRKESRTLADAVKFYTDGEHIDAHSAMADVRATINVIRAQLKRYPDIPTDRQGLSKYCNYDSPRADLAGKFRIDTEGDFVFNFGKNIRTKAKEKPEYLQWMIDDEFPADTKAVAQLILTSIRTSKT
jgi:DNA polymerase-3 subunit epsilon